MAFQHDRYNKHGWCRMLTGFVCVSNMLFVPHVNGDAKSQSSAPTEEQSVLLDQVTLASDARATQGLAVTEKGNFGATSDRLYRFDANWNLVDSRAIIIDGVNHMGAIHYYDGNIWAAFLNNGKTDGKHDPAKNRSIIAKIDANTLEVLTTWDVTEQCTWVDPVFFDGQHVWVGEMHNLGIHRYRLEHGKLVHSGVLRYPKEMSFSQGIRIRDGRLYSIHTFGSMDGLFEFQIPHKLTDEVIWPRRVWPIQESTMHLEGFDFVPGIPDEIWHAQGTQVDRYRLVGLGPD